MFRVHHFSRKQVNTGSTLRYLKFFMVYGKRAVYCSCYSVASLRSNWKVRLKIWLKRDLNRKMQSFAARYKFSELLEYITKLW